MLANGDTAGTPDFALKALDSKLGDFA